MGLKWECPADEICSTWALSYFSDCVCSRRDMISFFLGMTSIFCWAVAEIPQILLNWKSNHTEGVSLAFFFTWMIGDIFNLVGCWVNPGTLPTQFYMAVLFAIATLLLVGHQIRCAWMSYRASAKLPADEPLLGHASHARARRLSESEGLFPFDPTSITQSLPVMSKRVARPPLHMTPSLPVSPFSREPGALPTSVPTRANLLSPGTYSGSWRRLTFSNSYSASGSPAVRGILFSSLVIIGVTLSGLSAFHGGKGFKHHGTVAGGGSQGRRLLQDDEEEDMAQSVGLILGWLMTCIYLTGRLPQIILNWSRDFVIGVSASAMVFAFLGNATYLGSILVRSVEWTQLKPVLPWVVDIACCLAMDFFMTFQFLVHHQKEGYAALE